MKKLNVFYRVLLILSLVALAAKFGGLISWREVPLWVMIPIFFFAGVTHFTPLRHDFAKMIPPMFPAKMFLVYLTGVMEIAGAIMLAIPEYRLITSILMSLFLVAIFPANYYAAEKDIRFRGARQLSAGARGLVQVGFILALLVGGGVI